MPENIKNSLSPDEIIDFFEKNYNDEQQQQIVKILFRLDRVIESSSLLEDLIAKNVIQISSTPNIQYCLEKYFEAKNIEKISERKDFIISKIPDLKGLKRGKSASYEDLIDFISKNYYDEFKKILSDIKIYSFSEPYSQNGRTALLYLNRKLNPQANYKFDSRSNSYVLKDDEVTEVLRRHNIQFEVDNPASLFMGNIKCEKTPSRLPAWKVILFIIFWPIGLYYLISKKMRDVNDK